MSGHPMQAVRRCLRQGYASILAIALSIGLWAFMSRIAAVVLAEGMLVVQSEVKKIQHPTGGIVAEIKVTEGAHVKEGDVLLRLDDTIARASVSIADATLGELTARRLRLEAERDGRTTLVLPADASPQAARMLPGEQRLLELRARVRDGQSAQLRERIAQAREQIRGLDEQIAAKQDELAFIRRELDGVRQLFAKNLVPINRLNALERDLVRIEGDARQLGAIANATRGKITETELQIEQIDQEMRSELAKDLREAEAKIAEAVEKKVTAEDQLKRIELRAPQDGVVHQLAAHTVGGTVGAGEELMQIVPTADALTVEVRILPEDIDRVHVGQPAGFRLPALDSRTTPELFGKVSRVGADIETEKQTGQNFYEVRLSLSPEQIARLDGARLVPGMPIETFIQTGERSVMSRVLKPLSDQLNYAFRER